MASQQSLRQLQETYQKPQKNFSKLPEDIHILLVDISERTSKLITTKNPDELTKIGENLNEIRGLMQTIDSASYVKILNDIQAVDKERWKGHKWEVVRFYDKKYHENNQEEAHKRTGITADALVAIAKTNSKKEPLLNQIILVLVQIYGPTLDILRGKF